MRIPEKANEIQLTSSRSHQMTTNPLLKFQGLLSISLTTGNPDILWSITGETFKG